MLLESLSDERAVSSPDDDLDNTLRAGPTLLLPEQNRSVAFMHSPIFREWLIRKDSYALLVNGNANHVARRSAMTFVAAKLADSLYRCQHLQKKDDKTKLIALHFFGGEHVDCCEDVDASPAGVLCSLLTQLVKQHASFQLAHVMRHTPNCCDTEELLHLFAALLKQLPEAVTVFCIIDGLSYYNDKARAEDTATLIRGLARLTHLIQGKDGRKRCTFKLLLTAAKRLQSSGVDCLAEDQILTLPPQVSNQGGFTALKWEVDSQNLL